MKKQINFLFLLIGAVSIISILYWVNLSDDQLNNQSDRNFKITNIDGLNHIVISSNSNQSSLLKTNGIWEVNNQYLIDEQKIEALLNAIQFIEVKTIVPSKKAKELTSDSTKTIKIQFFKANELIKSYFLLGATSIGDAYMKMNDEKALPTINYLVGKSIPLVQLFNSNPFYWRNNTIIHYGISDFESVKINYSNNPSLGFTIINHNKDFQLIKNEKHLDSDQTDLEKINTYLQSFNAIEAVKYIVKPQNNQIDSVPFFTLTIQSVNKTEDLFVGYKRKINGRNSINSFYLLNNNKDWCEVNYVNFDPILVKADYFKKK